ncbi:MAG: hypothetical protein ACYDBJ_11930 [Aggregatilineales bacterium]
MFGSRVKVVSAIVCTAALTFAINSPTLIQAQSQSSANELVVRSAGILDADGSALYAITLASGTDALGNLTVSGVVPPNAADVEAVSAPPGATFSAQGGTAGTVTWQINQMDADTILGPFVYRVKLSDPSTKMPQNEAATVAWQTPNTGSAVAGVTAGNLEVLEDIGQLAIDPKGTVDANGQPIQVEVGKTGIEVIVPPGAVSQPTTLTFTRARITDQNAPSDVADVWWCAQVTISANPDVSFAQPLVIALPTQAFLTPGLAVQAFSPDGQGGWKAVNNAPPAAMRNGTEFVRFDRALPETIPPCFICHMRSDAYHAATLISNNGVIRVGVNNTARQAVKVNGSQLVVHPTNESGTPVPTVTAPKPPAITFLYVVFTYCKPGYARQRPIICHDIYDDGSVSGWYTK